MIYLACPYSHESKLKRIERFNQVSYFAGELMKQGEVVISPITHSHTIAELQDMPKDFEFWKHQDLTILSKCDKLVVLMLPGWSESKGVNAEMKYANENNIQIDMIAYDGI